MSNPITDLQESMENDMAADAYWNGIPTFTEKIDDIQSKIDIAVGKVNGICSVVVSPTGIVGDGRQNQPLYFQNVGVVVRTFEKPVINKTGKRALDVTLVAMAKFHLYQPSTGAVETVRAVKYQLGKDPKWFCYDAYFTTMGGVVYPVARLTDPAITETAPGVFSISGDTSPGAATFYTFTNAGNPDFVYPNPVQGTIYTGPFSATPPVTIYCRTWLPGKLSSNYIKRSFQT